MGLPWDQAGSITEGEPIEGRKPWYISITAPGFPDKKILNVIQSKDQQIVDIEKLIKQYIKTGINSFTGTNEPRFSGIG